MTDREAIRFLNSGLICSPFYWAAKKIAIAALEERDERSKECEYCKRERKPIDWAYCPKCGRKLKGETNE